MIYLSTFFLALFVTMAAIPLLLRGATRIGAVDLPSPRKVHERPMPKTGGVGIALGALVPVAVWVPFSPFVWALLAAGAIVVVFGVVDDLKELGYRAKFAGQLAAALVLVFYGGVKIRSLGMLLPDALLLPDVIAVPLTVLVLLGVTNAINLADGLDGLAGGIGGLSFGCIGLLAYHVGDVTITLICAAVGGAILGFLRFNSYPATVFMGDAGSQFLGLVSVGVALRLTQQNGPLSPLLPLIILGFPVLDTLGVMTERIAHGRSPFLADKNHFHHKLMRLGLFHADAVRLIYVLQAGLVTSAYLLRYHSDWLILLSYVAFCLLVVGGLQVAESAGWRIRRYAPVIAAAKTRVQDLRNRGLVVKFAFRALIVGLQAVLILSCFVPDQVPGAYGVAAALLSLVLLVGILAKRAWAASLARMSMFLLLPFLVYLGETQCDAWFDGGVMRFYNLSIVGLVVLSLVVIKLTRRKHFRSTPLDLLILFVAVIVPYVGRDTHHMGVITAKMLALFFVFEVFLAELRNDQRWLKAGVFSALTVVAVRGVVG